MRVVQVNEVRVIDGRPYTLELRGYVGASRFWAELEGVNLEIKSPVNYLNESQVQELEEQLQDLFPMPFTGPFKQSEIDEMMENNNSVILIKV